MAAVTGPARGDPAPAHEPGVLLTIIVLTYNSARFVTSCLDSLRPLSSEDVEIIVVDGGSSDATIEAVRRTAPFARVVQARGTNIPEARNVGLRVACGQYVLFLDSDDRLLADGFAAMKTLLETSAPDFAYASYGTMDETGNPTGTAHPGNVRGWGPLFNNPYGMLATAARRDLLLRLGGFREDLVVCEDYDLWLRVSEVASGIEVDASVAERRIRTDSATQSDYAAMLASSVRVGLSAAKREGAPRVVRLAVVGQGIWRILSTFRLNYVLFPLPPGLPRRAWSRWRPQLAVA